MHQLLYPSILCAAVVTFSIPAGAQPSPEAPPPTVAAAAASSAATVPADYVIGPDDVLAIVFWRDRDMSAEVVVRPDGLISLPLLNDVQAAGLTPDALRAKVTGEAKRYIEDPNVSVVVKEVRSRKVFITGNVERPGPYVLGGPMTVVQLIAMAGGVREYADSSHIIIVRQEGAEQKRIKFNYQGLLKHNVSLATNISLKPGDTVIVP
jgi:polysaccharide export outer membrane protein